MVGIMKFSKAIKTTLAATAFLATFSIAYAGDADVDSNVTQSINLQEISLDSTSGEANAFVGSLAAFDGSAVTGDLDVTITAKAIDMDTTSGDAFLSIGGVSAGQTSN